jgi:transcriptional regulator with XRE-family HTH domain
MTPFERKRLAAGLSQPKLADRVGVDQSTVSRWESGDCRPEAKHYPKLAKVFGITADEAVSLFAPETPATAA